MNQTIPGMVLDGSGALAQTATPITMGQGEYTVITVPVTDQAGVAFNLTGFVATLCIRKSRLTTTAIVSRENDGTLSSSGIITFTFRRVDTYRATPSDYVYDVYITEVATEKDYRVVPERDQSDNESIWTIEDAIVNFDDPVTSAGPDMLLVGIPVPGPSDVGKAIIVADDSPATLEFGDATGGGADLSDATPQAVGTAAAGTGTEASRDDHKHAHGNQLGGALHADVVSGGASGFMTGTQSTKLAGIASSATNTPLSSATPAAVGAAAAGSGSSASKDDHVHAHGNQAAGGSMHAAATTSVAGFMSATDKTKIDNALAPCQVRKLSTPAAEVGDTIVLYGFGLSVATGFDFGGIAAITYSLVSDTRATVVVPAGALSAKIGVKFGGAIVYSDDSFTVVNRAALTIKIDSVPVDPRLTYDSSSITLQSTNTTFLSQLTCTSPDIYVLNGCLDWTVRFIWSKGGQTGYIYSAASPDGAISLRIAGTTASMSLTCCVRGADGGGPITIIAPEDGDEVEIRLVYERNGGSYHITTKYNGTLYADRISQGAGANGVLSTPTSLYLGSNLGASALPMQKLTYFSSVVRPYGYLSGAGIENYEFVVMGDSISNNDGKYIYTPAERYARQGVYNCAGGGLTIATTKSLWDASPIKGNSALTAAVILVGYNDIVNSGRTATQWKTDMEALIVDIKAANPTIKVVLTQLTPTATIMNSTMRGYRTTINSNIASLAVVGQDAAVTAHNAILDDGSGDYRSEFSTGDFVHPNNAGRIVIAAAWRDALIALGLL